MYLYLCTYLSFPAILICAFLASTIQTEPQQADPLQPAEGDALEIACSSSSLETDEGIAECTALCAPAQCCQTGIGSENCGFAACLTYGDCLALASLFGVDVPPEAEDMVNGGEDGEDELVDESEMGMTNADNTTDTTDGDDGDKPTGDGSFNDPEEGSLMDKLNDMAEGLKETAKQAMTDPSSLSTGAKVGIAIGCFIIFMMLVCLIKCCCCRKKSS